MKRITFAFLATRKEILKFKMFTIISFLMMVPVFLVVGFSELHWFQWMFVTRLPFWQGDTVATVFGTTGLLAAVVIASFLLIRNLLRYDPRSFSGGIPHSL